MVRHSVEGRLGGWRKWDFQENVPIHSDGLFEMKIRRDCNRQIRRRFRGS